jgi:chitin synthase
VIENITGGIDLINIMRWLLVGSVLIYFLPILVYVLLFGNPHIFWEIILGYFSFLFYTPTYLEVLNIYSLCRIDDISWGTKGLDGAATADKGLLDSWKLIKMVHVGKYVIWNVILAAVLLTLGAGYEFRFYITLVLVSMIAVSLSVKVIVGIFYMLAYKCGNSCMQEKKPMFS